MALPELFVSIPYKLLKIKDLGLCEGVLTAGKT
jgi:hypothetical protein